MYFSGHPCQNTMTKVQARSVPSCQTPSPFLILCTCCSWFILPPGSGRGRFHGSFSEELPPLQEEDVRQHVGPTQEARSSMCQSANTSFASAQLMFKCHFFFFLMVWRRCFLFQVRTGYDGLGGRTKYFQPVSFSATDGRAQYKVFLAVWSKVYSKVNRTILHF